MAFRPLDPNGYPLAGERIGPAWRALLAVTEPGTWVSQRAAMQAMESAGPIGRKTAANLIRLGHQDGFLDREQIQGTRAPRQYRIRRRPTTAATP